MKARLAFLLLIALASPARAADPDPPPRTDCTREADSRDKPANPETSRGTKDEQLCLRVDRAPDGRALELYGGKVEGGRGGGDPLLERPRDDVERRDGFFGMRLKLPLPR